MASNPRKLSPDQVAALVGELPERQVVSATEGVEIRPYALGSTEISTMGEYHALRMIHERFCRIARGAFQPMLRVQPRISAFPAEARSFDDYRSGQDNFLSLTNTRIEELRGSHLIVIPPSFVSLLTDAYYGGTIRSARSGRTEFTGTESRVIEIVTDRLNSALQMAWRDLMPLTFTVVSREENMQFAAFVDGGDMVVNCSFMVQLPDAEPARFDILYPFQTLKPISTQLRSRTQSESTEDDASWRERLERAVMSIPLSVRTRLCEPDIALRHLANLKEGDVIPARVTDTVEILVDGRPFFEAVPGELAGKSALSITKRIRG